MPTFLGLYMEQAPDELSNEHNWNLLNELSCLLSVQHKENLKFWFEKFVDYIKYCEYWDFDEQYLVHGDMLQHQLFDERFQEHPVP